MAASDPRLLEFTAPPSFFETVFAETAAEGRALARAGAGRASKLIAQSTFAVIRSREAIAESRILLARCP